MYSVLSRAFVIDNFDLLNLLSLCLSLITHQIVTFQTGFEHM